ncbi:hypothetical protein [Pseudoxanthomonas sp.]|uniref:hypothetical protein n=1 Tax=Pseudoxanthomonas sp. TaxID=1871049 RepID=UPI0026204232|nr:hypothetical protein [Pseudoxanthomonas sp.]WDS34759.1 MAG: hypothetical protein O8I58_10170 [Pseudoxanthomonas sp.]
MFKDVIDAGGPGLLIPTVLFALAFYVIRGVFGVHGRKSQHRSEFLERWDPKRIDDDLWLEVTIRQLFGMHLPAHAIRVALLQPHSSQALIDLSELWNFLHYDSEHKVVRWLHKRHKNPRTRRFARYLGIARYVMLAMATTTSTIIAYNATGLSQWVYASLAIILTAGAFISVTYDEAEKIANTQGEAWINKIKNSIAPLTN